MSEMESIAPRLNTAEAMKLTQEIGPMLSGYAFNAALLAIQDKSQVAFRAALEPVIAGIEAAKSHEAPYFRERFERVLNS
jgi:hypothetical protein